MKKLALTLATIIGVVAAIPAATTAQAETKKVIIKRGGHDHGRHMGWRHRGGGKKVVIIKKRGHRHDM